jgi:hydroxymethylpyrimidine pyrophosphatase-like HAD family hydrolase
VPREVQIVATDLDGTLWDRDARLPAEHRLAIARLTSAGVPLLAATARGPRSAVETIAGNRMEDVPVACLNGAIGLEPDGSMFMDRSFSREDAEATLDTFERYALKPCLAVFDQLSEQIISAKPSTCSEHLQYLGPRARIDDLWDTVREQHVYAMSIAGRRRVLLTGVASALRTAGVSWLTLTPDPVYAGWTLRVRPLGVDKWSATRAYCLAHGISPSAVLGVGDGLDDVPLLRSSAVAVAVRHGHPEAVRLSTHLIEPVRQRGWAQVPALAGT